MRYRIGKRPNTRAAQNVETWTRLEAKLGTGSASESDILRWCAGHDHAEGAAGFLRYCKKNGWLVPG